MSTRRKKADAPNHDIAINIDHTIATVSERIMLHRWQRKTVFTAALMVPVACSMFWVRQSLANDSLFNVFSRKGTDMQVATKINELTEDDDVSNIDFSPNGAMLAVTTFTTGHIHIWNLKTRHIEKVFWKPKGGGTYSETDSLFYSPDGKQLAVTMGLAGSTQEDGEIWIFDPASGAVLSKIMEPQGGGLYSRTAFLPDGKSFIRTYNAGGPGRKQFIVHDTHKWNEIWGLNLDPLDIMTVAVSPNGDLAAVGGVTNGENPNKAQIQIIDLEARKVIHTIEEVFPPYNVVQKLAWSASGDMLAAGGTVGGTFSGPDVVRVFDKKNWQMIAHQPYPDAAQVAALRYSPDGKYLIVAGLGKIGDEKVQIWKADYSTLLQEINVKDTYAVSLSKDSRYLALSDQRHVTIWALK